MSGWVIGLFPYFRSGEKNHHVWWTHLREHSPNFYGITTDQFPMSLNKVPFKLIHHSIENDMLFIGGLLSVRYDLRDHSLTPVFAYAIAEDEIKAKESTNDLDSELMLWYLHRETEQDDTTDDTD